MDVIDTLKHLANEQKPWSELLDTARKLDIQCSCNAELYSRWKTVMTAVLKYSALVCPTRPHPRFWNVIEVFDQHVSR
jgi:hypothetical protein